MNFLTSFWNGKETPEDEENLNNKAFKELIESSVPKYTPDIAHIENLKYTWLFNYIPGLLNKIPVRDLDIKEVTAFTDFKGFLMWRKNLGMLSFPVPMNYIDTVQSNSIIRKMKENKNFKSNYIHPPGRIRGQLVLINNPGQHLIELDNQFVNTVQFERIRTKIIIPFHRSTYDSTPSSSGQPNLYYSPEIARVRAWMYVGKPTYWYDQIVDFEQNTRPYIEPVLPFHAKNEEIGPYYMFRSIDRDDKAQPVLKASDYRVLSETSREQVKKNLQKLAEERSKLHVPGNRK